MDNEWNYECINDNTVSALLAETFISSLNTHTKVQPHLPAGSALVRGMNLVSLQPLLLHLICLNGDMSVPSTHTHCLFFIRADTDQRSFFFSLRQLRQTMRGKKWRENSLSFYISIFAREASRQAVWNVNVCLWLMWDHSDGCTQWYNEHTHTHTLTHTHTDSASGWGGRVQLDGLDKTRSPR